LSLPSSNDAPNTDPGVVMGTVGYMSPEQVQGQIADHRSDIFSFGVILYEMLSGQRAFTGSSMVETMHAILKSEPPELSETNAKISPALDKIVRRCLEKKPERRFQTASDLGFALEALATASSSGATRTEAVAALTTGSSKPGSGWRERIAWIAAGVLALALLALGVAYVRRPALEAEPVRFLISPPDKATYFGTPMISPDGRTLAFVATVEGKPQIWVRPLNATTTRPLVEKSGPSIPFWSPDSRFIVSFINGSLKKVSLADGTTVALCETPSASTGAWSRAGIILFGAGADGIKRVSADGGAVTAVTMVDKGRGEISHATPVFLPDDRHFLFYITNNDPAKTGIYAASLDGGAATLVMPLETPQFVVTAKPGAANECLLLFVRQGALLVQSLDLSRFQPAGEPVRLAVQMTSRFTVSENGVLVMSESRANQQLAWFDRAGQKPSTVGPVGIYFTLHLSPDEQRLAAGLLNPQTDNYDIRLFDLTRGGDARFTTDPATDSYPLWSPDGQSIVWSSNREGVWNLYQKAANGAGTDELLLRSAYSKLTMDWSADGRFLLYRELNSQTGYDLWVLPMEGERKPWPWLNSPFVEGAARFSPDGKWIAYSSNESGRHEIYVQAFVPGAAASGGKVLFSTNGGQQPHWRRDGRELYYRSPDGNLMAVDVTLGAAVKVGTPKPLFSLNNIRALTDFASTGDGQRFLFVTNAEDASVPPFTVVLNWMAEMKR
jgi:Tol biopolymer transport system component